MIKIYFCVMQRVKDSNGTLLKGKGLIYFPLIRLIQRKIYEYNREYISIIPKIADEKTMFFLQSEEIKKEILREKILLLSDLLLYKNTE